VILGGGSKPLKPLWQLLHGSSAGRRRLPPLPHLWQNGPFLRQCISILGELPALPRRFISLCVSRKHFLEPGTPLRVIPCVRRVCARPPLRPHPLKRAFFAHTAVPFTLAGRVAGGRLFVVQMSSVVTNAAHDAACT